MVFAICYKHNFSINDKTIIADKRIQTWTAKKRKHSEILIPLSPITPGTTGTLDYEKVQWVK